jgi:hypothetical protein
MRLVGVAAAVLVVAGMLWREAVGTGVVRSSPDRRRAVEVALVALGLLFVASATATVVALL